MKYPKFLKLQIRSYQKYLDKHATSNWYARIEGKAINAFYYVLFCKTGRKAEKEAAKDIFENHKDLIPGLMKDYFGIDFEA